MGQSRLFQNDSRAEHGRLSCKPNLPTDSKRTDVRLAVENVFKYPKVYSINNRLFKTLSPLVAFDENKRKI